MATVVRMPEVLANTSEAAIQNWLVQPGDSVVVGSPLAEVETEKAVVEYAAETGGTVLTLLVSEGQLVAVGEPIALIGDPDEAREIPDPEPVPSDSSAPEPETAFEGAESPVSQLPTELPTAASAAPIARRFASPIVRRLARERGVDLSRITGSGPDGRIIRLDLERAQAPAAAEPQIDRGAAVPALAPVAGASAATGFVDVPLSPMRRAIARRLTESKSTVPHFYMSADCRVDALLQLRSEINDASPIRVSVNDFVMKAVAGALVDVPEANSTWNDGSIRRFTGVDIALAVALDDGLVTPVLRAAQSLPVLALASATADLAARAKTGKLRQHELEGGVTTVSNLGMYGVKEFSAILNPPQSTILAVGAASPRPVVINGVLEVATMLTLTLSADHRVVDGAVAARLLAAIVRRLETPLLNLL
jgi:pyruvate dehydrogenase E2 component (dihydrolipoamide acetyltransferase)